jgi:hypothetical protein
MSENSNFNALLYAYESWPLVQVKEQIRDIWKHVSEKNISTNVGKQQGIEIIAFLET